jgi:plasmid stabilization system protein ParE
LSAVYTPLARSDITAHIAYYAQVASVSTAQRFSDAIDAAVARAEMFPEGSPVREENDARCVNLRDFKFSIWYDLDGQDIVVLRVTHWSMDPETVHRLIESSR